MVRDLIRLSPVEMWKTSLKESNKRKFPTVPQALQISINMEISLNGRNERARIKKGQVSTFNQDLTLGEGLLKRYD